MSSRARKLVVAALVRQSGRILLTQRRADQPMPLKWEFPGGKIEAGEAPEAALQREILEELGVACRVDGISEVLFHRYPEFDLYLLVYACTLLEAPRPVEVAQLVWATPEELGRYEVLPADQPLIEQLMRGG